MKFVFVAFFALATLRPLAATSLSVDPKTSKVAFRIFKFKIGAEVPGLFEKFSGSFEVDDKNKLLKSAKGEIKADSIFTDSAKRNRHLKSKDFFDVETFPLITFDLKSHTGPLTSGKVKGSLTMKGVTRDLELVAVVKNSEPKNYEIELKGKLNRKDYNIVWNEILDKGGFVLADDVQLELLIKASPSP